MTQISKQASKRSRPTACCACVDEAARAGLFKALGDPNRVALLVRLAEIGKPCTVSQAAGCCPTDISVVSRHLALLRDAGVLEAEKRGREVYYSVRYAELVSTLRRMADAVEGCCRTEKRGKKGSRS
jgi:ArsR family transcriptional regulator